MCTLPHHAHGALPHPVRQAQTKGFNDAVGEGREAVLVATDAIAYGLNLNIRRIVLSTTRKFNGKVVGKLTNDKMN
eukprot:gene3094-2371_t